MKQGWEIKKLGEVCDFQGGSQPPKEEWIDEPREGYVRMLQIRDFTQSRSFDIEYVKESNRLKYCNEDDVLLGRYGASVGKVLTGLAGAYNVAIMKTMPNKDLLNKSYFKYFLESPSFQVFLQQASTMRAAQAGFSKEDIQDFTIPVPPREEQERIVAELDCLSGVIEKKREQLRELDALAQSIFYSMFGDPITNEKGWEVKKLGEVCKTTSGGTPSKGHNEYYEGGTIPWLRSGEVNKMYIYNAELFITEEGLQNSSAKWFPENTVVVAMYGATVGQVGILKNKMTTNQAICGIFPNEYFIPTYLYHFLLSKKEEYLKLATGGAQPNISQNIVRDTLVCCPPIATQQEFADKIEAIEKQKALIKQSIAQTETLFNARMDYYFN